MGDLNLCGGLFLLSAHVEGKRVLLWRKECLLLFSGYHSGQREVTGES